MSELKRTFAVIVGKGEIPCDMLRYDCAFPDSSDDAYHMQHSSGDDRDTMRVFMLATYVGRFTPARWQSFGWSCREFKNHYEASQHCKLMRESLCSNKV
jgi:hypothetical protein